MMTAKQSANYVRDQIFFFARPLGILPKWLVSSALSPGVDFIL
jgi:hypothetical protein